MLQVCVIGLGQFGSQLARTLARMKCDVLAVDADETTVDAIRNDVQRAVIADARDRDAIAALVTPDTDAVILGLSESVETSVLCALHLRQIGVKNIHAKASSEDHAAVLRAIGIANIVFPERDTAERMAQHLVNPNLLDYLQLSKAYRLAEISVPKNFVGQSLADLHLRKRHGVLVIAIRKPANDGIVFMPPAETVLVANSILAVIGKDAEITKLHQRD